MKRILLIICLFTAGAWAMSMKSGYCELEQEATHKAALPVVEALAAYAKEHGIPNLDSFEQIEDIPYELKPCSERPDLMECEVLKRGYYFQIEEEYYSIEMWGGEPSAFGLTVVHNYTDCLYTIYKKNKLLDNYPKASCSLIGRCRGWFRQ